MHRVFSVSQGAADCGEDWEDGVILSGFYSRDRTIEVRMNKTNGLPEEKDYFFPAVLRLECMINIQ